MSKGDVDVFIPIFGGDYLKKTSRLNTLLHGAYFLLILDYWHNGPPPDDDAILADITLMDVDAWRNARSRLQGYFHVIDGEWRHNRIDAELEKAKGRKAKSQKGIEARWPKKPDPPSIPRRKAPASAKQSHKECPSPSPVVVVAPTGQTTTTPDRPGGDLKAAGPTGEARGKMLKDMSPAERAAAIAAEDAKAGRPPVPPRKKRGG